MRVVWTCLCLLALTLSVATAQQGIAITQKRRAFEPKEVTISAGEALIFVNDDGELLHHVYSRDPGFAFDLGEQPPGSRTPMRINTRGTFSVHCEIHPRMLLHVTVR